MHQSFDRGAFTLYATESKWILAKVNGMNSFAPICPTRTILPFFKKKTDGLKIMFYSLLESSGMTQLIQVSVLLFSRQNWIVSY